MSTIHNNLNFNDFNFILSEKASLALGVKDQAHMMKDEFFDEFFNLNSEGYRSLALGYTNHIKLFPYFFNKNKKYFASLFDFKNRNINVYQMDEYENLSFECGAHKPFSSMEMPVHIFDLERIDICISKQLSSIVNAKEKTQILNHPELSKAVFHFWLGQWGGPTETWEPVDNFHCFWFDFDAKFIQSSYKISDSCNIFLALNKTRNQLKISLLDERLNILNELELELELEKEYTFPECRKILPDPEMVLKQRKIQDFPIVEPEFVINSFYRMQQGWFGEAPISCQLDNAHKITSHDLGINALNALSFTKEEVIELINSNENEHKLIREQQLELIRIISMCSEHSLILGSDVITSTWRYDNDLHDDTYLIMIYSISTRKLAYMTSERSNIVQQVKDLISNKSENNTFQ